MPLRMISVCYTAEKSEEAPALGKDEEEQEELVGVEAQTNEVLAEEVIKTNDDLDHRRQRRKKTLGAVGS